MKVSLRIVETLIGRALPPVSELVERVNARLGKVEHVVDLGEKYKDARIVRVIGCEKHPDADKLSVCQIDDGGVMVNTERSADGFVQVVCGAPNVHADMWAVWLPPGSTVPATYDDAEPFVLGARTLRGVMSQGMLAAADELAIGSDHEGIVEITERDVPVDMTLTPGASFAEVFGLNDTIIDIENKMFTHRPDLFGQLGVAREIFAIFQEMLPSDTAIDNRFENPDWYWSHPEFSGGSGLALDVFNDAPDASPRFMAVALKNVVVTKSPLWLQCQLVALGAKPINTIVDLTNYIMLMTAQPTHAYDYDKLRGHTIGVRMAKQGEKTVLLNEKEYELTSDDIVIADGEGAIGLAGVMGGLESEVTASTKNIVLEVANFDMYAIRKTSMRHGLFTDAVTRFNKGQSPLQTTRVLKRLMDLLPGEQASNVFDVSGVMEQLHNDSVHGEVLIDVAFINERLGTQFTGVHVGNILRAANVASFPPGDDENVLSVTAPYWRTDIALAEDIVEEVGRLYGFDRLPRELPKRTAGPVPTNIVRDTKRRIRESLKSYGANEVLSYSFVHENVLKKAEQDSSHAFKLSNALSPDLQYLRLSVLPSLLDKVHMNIKAGHDEFTLFEIGKGHNKKYHASDDEGLPKEIGFVDAVYARKKPADGAPLYVVKRLVSRLAEDLGCDVTYMPITEALDYPVTAPFDLERSALVETSDGVFLGMIGELKQSVMKRFKLPAYTAAVTLDLEGLVRVASSRVARYRPLSRYPSVSQDVSIKVASDRHYSDVFAQVRRVADTFEGSVVVRPVSIYQAGNDATTKTLTFRLTCTSHERTLADGDISPIVRRIEQLS